MKKYFILLASGLFLLSGCVRNEVDDNPIRRGQIRFVASIDQDDATRATFKGNAETGVSTASWTAEDMVGIFAVDASGAAVSTNVAYKAVANGTIAELVPAGSDEVAKAEKYYACFGYQSSNSGATPTACGYNLAATTVAGSVVGNVVRPTAADNNNHHLFYGEGSVSGKTVSMEFKTVFSVLEFGLRGSAKLTSMRVELPESATGRMASTGTINLTDGTLSRQGEGERYLVADFTQLEGGYLQLSNTVTRLQLAVDDFTTSEGLVITFVNHAGESFSKTIWASAGEQRSFIAEGKPNHIYQPLAAVTDYDFSGDYRNIALRADMLSADNPQSDEGSLAELVDGDLNTYYHGSWSNPTDCPHYVVVKLDAPINGFHVDITNRLRGKLDADINVRNLNVYVSTDTFDGTNYDVTLDGVRKVLALSDLANEDAAVHSLPDYFDANETFNTIYLEVASTWGSSKFFAWSELSVKERLTAVPFENYDAPDTEVFEKVNINGSRIWLDCYEASEGEPANLVDGDLNSIIHFPWSAPKPWPHYIVMGLDDPLTGFMFAYTGRNAADPDNHPRNMNVYVSKKFDGTFDTSSATFVGNYYNLPSYVDAQPSFNSKAYCNTDDSFKYVWFEINSGWGSADFCSLAEIEIYKYKGDVVEPGIGFLDLYAKPLNSQYYNSVKIEGVQAVWASSEELEGEGDDNGAFRFAFDGNAATYYHGNWVANDYNGYPLPHYLVYDLGAEVTEPLMINLVARATTSGDFPKNFNIYTSSTNIYNGTGYSLTDDLQLIAEVKNCTKPDNGGQVMLGTFDHSNAARYVMIELTATASGQSFTALGEIETYKAVAKSYTKSKIEGVKAVWASSDEPEEAPNGYLSCAFDNNYDTFYHGSWTANDYDGMPLPHYLVFDLGSDVSDMLCFALRPRNHNNQDFPSEFKFYGTATNPYNSESGEFSTPEAADMIGSQSNVKFPGRTTDYVSDIYSHSSAVRYITLEIDQTTSGANFVALSEITSYICTEE